MSEVNFSVFENNDPLRTFVLSDTLTNGSTTATNLTNAVVELYIKANQRDTDAQAVAKYSTATGEITIESPATNGRVLVQFAAIHLGIAGKRRYHLDVIRSGKRLTYAHGIITVENI